MTTFIVATEVFNSQIVTILLIEVFVKKTWLYGSLGNFSQFFGLYSNMFLWLRHLLRRRKSILLKDGHKTIECVGRRLLALISCLWVYLAFFGLRKCHSRRISSLEDFVLLTVRTLFPGSIFGGWITCILLFLINQTRIAISREHFSEGYAALGNLLMRVALAGLRIRCWAMGCALAFSFLVVTIWSSGCGYHILSLVFYTEGKTVVADTSISVQPLIMAILVIMLTVESWWCLLRLKYCRCYSARKVAWLIRMLLRACPLTRLLFRVNCFAVNIIAILLANLADWQLHPAFFLNPHWLVVLWLAILMLFCALQNLKLSLDTLAVLIDVYILVLALTLFQEFFARAFDSIFKDHGLLILSGNYVLMVACEHFGKNLIIQRWDLARWEKLAATWLLWTF